MSRTQETIRSVNLCHRTRLWVMCDVSPHLPRTVTQRHPWKQILGVWPPRRSRSAARHSRTSLGVGTGGWTADVGSGEHSRDTPLPSPRSPVHSGVTSPREGGARLPGMGEEVCSDLASASPASRPQRRVGEDPRGSPMRIRVPDIYSLRGHQTCGPAHAPLGQDRGSWVVRGAIEALHPASPPHLTFLL